MKERIKKLLPWIYVVLIVNGLLLLLTLLSFHTKVTSYSSFTEKAAFILTVPSVIVTQFNVTASINEFASRATELSALVEAVIFSGTGIMMVLLVAPFLLVKGYNKFNPEKNDQRSLAWYLGAGIITISLTTAFLSITVGSIAYMNTSEQITDGQDSDALRSELLVLALDAVETMTLPQEFGGGDGTFTNLKAADGATSIIQLQDLENYSSQSAYEFFIQEDITDSTITIIGLSERRGNNPEFENINGDVGKRQRAVKVTPYEDNIFRFLSGKGNN